MLGFPNKASGHMRICFLVASFIALAGCNGGHKEAADFTPEALDFFKQKYEECRAALFSNNIADKPILAFGECRSDQFTVLGHYNQAFEEANIALAANPDLPVALLNRAIAYHADHKWDAAFADIDKMIGIATATESDRAVAYYIRAEFTRGGGELERAIEEAGKAIQLDPVLVYPYLLRGRVLNEQLRADLAAKDFDRAYELSPNDTNVLLERSLFRSSNRQFSGAMSDLDAAIALEPKDHYLYFQRAKVWARMGNRKRAREDFDKANELAAAE